MRISSSSFDRASSLLIAVIKCSVCSGELLSERYFNHFNYCDNNCLYIFFVVYSCQNYFVSFILKIFIEVGSNSTRGVLTSKSDLFWPFLNIIWNWLCFTRKIKDFKITSNLFYKTSHLYAFCFQTNGLNKSLHLLQCKEKKRMRLVCAYGGYRYARNGRVHIDRAHRVFALLYANARALLLPTSKSTIDSKIFLKISYVIFNEMGGNVIYFWTGFQFHSIVQKIE